MTNLGIVVACRYKGGYACLEDDDGQLMLFSTPGLAENFIKDEMDDKPGTVPAVSGAAGNTSLTNRAPCNTRRYGALPLPYEG